MISNIVWSKDSCSFCDRAKTLLTSKNIPFEERKIGAGWTKEQLLNDVPTARSVPQIFMNGQHIGGYTELANYLK
jgi:glutaredoxin